MINLPLYLTLIFVYIDYELVMYVCLFVTQTTIAFNTKLKINYMRY